MRESDRFGDSGNERFSTRPPSQNYPQNQQQMRESDRFGDSGTERFSTRPTQHNFSQQNQMRETLGGGWEKGNATKGEGGSLDNTAQNDISALLGSLRSQMANIQTDYKKPASRGVCGKCGGSILADMINARGFSQN